MHNFPSRSSRLPGFPERCGVGVSWSRRGRFLPRRVGSPLTITSVPLPAPASIPSSLGEPGRRSSPTTRGKGGRRAGTVTQTPPPTSAAGLNWHRRPRLRAARGLRPGEPREGCDASGTQSQLPTRASLRVLGPWTRTMPRGRGSGTVVAAPRVPSAASTPTWKASGGSGGRRTRPGGREGWPGSEARTPPAPGRGLQHRQRRRGCASSGPPRRSPSSPTGGARWRGGAPGSPPPAPASLPRARGSAGGSGAAGGRRARPAGHPFPRRRGSRRRGCPPAWAHPGPARVGTAGGQRSPLWSPTPGIPGPERHRSDPARPGRRRWAGPGSQRMAPKGPSARGLERLLSEQRGREDSEGHSSLAASPEARASRCLRPCFRLVGGATALSVPAPRWAGPSGAKTSQARGNSGSSKERIGGLKRHLTMTLPAPLNSSTLKRFPAYARGQLNLKANLLGRTGLFKYLHRRFFSKWMTEEMSEVFQDVSIITIFRGNNPENTDITETALECFLGSLGGQIG